jgi:hypothetical protein
MRVAAVGILVLFSLPPSEASGEIEKRATTCEQVLCFHWWPKLPAFAGWHQDEPRSFAFGCNALAPDGSSFGDADTVMYAKALYKPRDPETTSLEMLIEQDKQRFAKEVPGIAIAEAPSLATADGQKLRSLTFFPKGEGNWERVAYGEEGDFYLVFAVSSLSRKGYEAALPAYERLVGRYREKP